MSVYFALFHELCICVSSFRGFESSLIMWLGTDHLTSLMQLVLCKYVRVYLKNDNVYIVAELRSKEFLLSGHRVGLS